MIEYEKNDALDALALRISAVVDGEQMSDVALAAALLAGYSIANGFEPEGREAALETIITFIRDTVANISKEQETP
jgi:hypothetical protein